MKPSTITPRPANRVRKFTREILLASAITLAAIAMFLASHGETEIAAVPTAVPPPAQSN
jgi:hypothetical protein